MPVTGGSSQPSLGRTSHCISNTGPKLWGRTMCHSLLNLLNAAWHKATEQTALTGSTSCVSARRPDFFPGGLPGQCPARSLAQRVELLERWRGRRKFRESLSTRGKDWDR